MVEKQYNTGVLIGVELRLQHLYCASGSSRVCVVVSTHCQFTESGIAVRLKWAIPTIRTAGALDFSFIRQQEEHAHMVVHVPTVSETRDKGLLTTRRA